MAPHSKLLLLCVVGLLWDCSGMEKHPTQHATSAVTPPLGFRQRLEGPHGIKPAWTSWHTTAQEAQPSHMAKAAAAVAAPADHAARPAAATRRLLAGTTPQCTTAADIKPLRNMWGSGLGYCTEVTVQNIMLNHGVWISQQLARKLPNCFALRETPYLNFRPRKEQLCNMFYVLRDMLALDLSASDLWDDHNQTLTYAVATSNTSWPFRNNSVGVTQPGAPAFLEWVKRQIIGGKPVIVAVRVKELPPVMHNAFNYDHIEPIFAVCSTDLSPTAPLQSSDTFHFTTDRKDLIARRADDSFMFARWKECPYAFHPAEGGCLASDYYNYGIAAGGLRDPTNILVKSSKLTITAWSNGVDPLNEPGEIVGTNATASYQLVLTGLKPGATYTTWRMQGLLSAPGTPATIPPDYAAMQSRCDTLGASCRSTTYVAPASGTATITEQALGTFPARSVQWFFTVRK